MLHKRHPIDAIEGIGKRWGGKLRDLGISATEDLLTQPEPKLRATLSKLSGFPVARLREFTTMAEFLLLEGMTGQFAEALYYANRRSLLKVAAPDAKTLVKELKDAAAAGRIPEGTTLAVATRWQKDAIAVRYTGWIAGEVAGPGGAVANATVYCGMQESRTDDSGRFIVPIAPYGRNDVTVLADGHSATNFAVTVAPDSNARVRITLSASTDTQADDVIDEKEGARLPTIRPQDRVRFNTVKFSALAEGTALIFQSFLKSGAARLTSVARTRVGNEIQVDRVTAPAGAITGTPARGTVYTMRKDVLVKSRQSLNQVRGKPTRDSLKALGAREVGRRVKRMALT